MHRLRGCQPFYHFKTEHKNSQQPADNKRITPKNYHFIGLRKGASRGKLNDGKKLRDILHLDQ